MRNLEKDFKSSLEAVAEILKIPPNRVSRDAYNRTAVDHDVPKRLSGAKLHEIGGFAHNRDKYYGAASSGPRVLIFDIETSPMLVYAWSLFDLKLSPSQIVEDWSILSYSAKWLDEDDVIYSDTSKMKDPRDDSELLSEIWELLNEADVLVTHNGVKFDAKKVNARLIEAGYTPPSKYRHFDTYQAARKVFKFTSNKLEYITRRLNDSDKRKLSHGKFPGFSLWKACLEGNKEAWKEMREYNIMDVVSLEQTAKLIMPWYNNINWGMYSNQDECSCGSLDIEADGVYYTNASRYVRFRCNSCGASFRGKTKIKDGVSLRPI